MAPDVSADVASLIAESKVYGSSDNIRHGIYPKMVIRRIFAELVDTDKGKHRMAFAELTVLESKVNPQIEGDKNADGTLRDDGKSPNPVGNQCALKVDFDGPGSMSAPANVKAFVLALYCKRDGEMTNEEVNKVWRDLSRQKDEMVNGEMKRANPACGMLIACTTRAKKKKVANDKGAYVTKLVWEGVSPPGIGENAAEFVAKRREEIEASMVGDEEADEVATPPANGAATASSNGNGHAPAPPQTLGAPPPPAAFTPPAPWVKHTSAWKADAPPEGRWYWSDPAKGGDNSVKSEAQLKASV